MTYMMLTIHRSVNFAKARLTYVSRDSYALFEKHYLILFLATSNGVAN
ncbi:MAG: hypothetical protein KatS3mg099_328 [Candidatus Parcubacteria bacterium]|nr:MAG: hypothetical protein KatS3mg099_328 [Candidatus Parcubacteria bacterium]